MKKNETETETPRRAGRPAGTTMGSLYITNSELIEIMKRTAKDTDTAPALMKTPQFQGGTDGRANSGRLYTPASWNGSYVLIIKLTDEQAADVLERDATAKVTAIRNRKEAV